MAYFDVQCANCGEFHHNDRRIERCPRCQTSQIVVAPHDFDVDARFRDERENMLDRMDVD